MEKPKPNVYITPTGSLRINLEGLTDYSLRWKLQRAHGATAMALTTTRTDRELLVKLLDDYESGNPHYIISDDAALAISDAVDTLGQIPPPILPLTPYEKLGAIDDIQYLVASNDVGKKGDNSSIHLTKHCSYKVTERSQKYERSFTRNKMHYSPRTGRTYTKLHDCQLEGKDTVFNVQDDNGNFWSFREHADNSWDISDRDIWKYFNEPDISTIKEVYPEEYERNAELLDWMEDIGGFKYFPGQREYLTRFSILNSGGCCIETGGGKTLAAFTLYYLKQAKRACFIVPKGTSVGEDGKKQKFDNAPQWFKEAQKFAPDTPVYKLFSKKDYYNLLDENGKLPTGIFITYPNAMFVNDKAFENMPKTKKWKDMDGEELFCKKYNIPFKEEYGIRYTSGIGEEINGFHCVATPSLSTLCRNQFDMVILDEAHLICNPHTNTTQGILKMQPKYRYAMTATPITNMCYNVFPIIGWLAVDDWRLERRRNNRWHYGLEEISRFKSAHVSKERDLTAEQDADKAGENRPTPKDSPAISQSPKLLYLLRKTLAYMSKQDINPDLVKCNLNVVKVPMGKQQHELYAHYLQRKNIPIENPLAKAMTQQTYLRGVCADPATVDYNDVEGKIVKSNYNPKTVSILNLICDTIQKGEQVVFVSARNGQINEIKSRLEEADIKCSMIRGDVKDQSNQAAMFKAGITQVMLLNIYCAEAHSFENCSQLIIGALEWSYGKYAQACGRIYRLNSPKDCTVNVVLHENTIEELLFEKVASKEDGATVCLKGEHVDSNHKIVDPGEILAEHFQNFTSKGSHEVMDEEECENQWPELLAKLKGETVLC